MNLEKLEKLHELKEKGILTDEEFEQEKKKLLNEITMEATAEKPNEIITEMTNEATDGVKQQKSKLLNDIIIVAILLIICSLTNCNNQPSFDYDAFARHVKSIRNY